MESLKDLKKFWKNKKVFITGHTGFKGTWLSIVLNYLESKIYGYSLVPQKNCLFNKAAVKKLMFSHTHGDINNINKLKKNIIKAKPEIVFHLAAQPLVIDSYNKPLQTLRTNIMGTANLLESIRSVKSIKAVLIITTDKVYKIQKKNRKYKELDRLEGDDPYSASKVGAEIVTNSYIKSFFKNSKLRSKISTVRAGNVIGGGDYSNNRLVPDIIKGINLKKRIIIRNPNNIRPWQHVLDPLIGYLILAKRLYKNKVDQKNSSWNFGPNKNNFQKVSDVIKYILRIEKFKFKIIKNKNYKETNILKLDSSKAKKILKWSSKWSLSETLNKTLEWNKLVKKGVSPKYICEQQFLMYINKKKS